MSLAQLLITVDVTIVNVALPQAQRSLGFSDASRQWVITAYALAFGSLLLIGGRIADRIGRRRTLAIGLVLFGVGSAIGGAALDFGILAAARTCKASVCSSRVIISCPHGRRARLRSKARASATVP